MHMNSKCGESSMDQLIGISTSGVVGPNFAGCSSSITSPLRA
jgi:hypothetical protein